MALKAEGFAVTPGQAKWIVARMLAERRISASEVRALVSDMGQEIATIESRLAALRGDVAAAPAPRKSEDVPKPQRPLKPKGHPRGIAGTLAVLLRSVPLAEHAAIQAIRSQSGIPAAIEAARSAPKRQR
ncbi:MAG TPA: hypothetical protein VGQ76_15370 [Thermoanaerobaculia bacterium]|jgi:hypothetical protein|nr:hypothetical protein [Thermoanaerobaculia bacterium]